MKTETQWTDRGPWAFYLNEKFRALRPHNRADKFITRKKNKFVCSVMRS